MLICLLEVNDMGTMVIIMWHGGSMHEGLQILSELA